MSETLFTRLRSLYQPTKYYTLRFETGGGSAIPGVQETYNTYIDLTKYVPTRHG